MKILTATLRVDAITAKPVMQARESVIMNCRPPSGLLAQEQGA